MKVGILTFFKNQNYGALLQCYALQSYLSKLNINCLILNYYSISKPQTNIVNLLKHELAKKDNNKINNACETFRKNYLNLTKELKKNELSKFVKDYDAIIVGSDQVWNQNYIYDDFTFFLDFPEFPIKKISYAASLGNNKFNDDLEKTTMDLLKNFNYISLREDTSINYLRKEINKDIIECIDPVFLLNKNQWLNLLSKRKKKEKYILYFAVQNKSPKVVKNFAKQIKKSIPMELIYLSTSSPSFRNINIKHASVCSPLDFLNLLYYAEFIITDSFHGTAFSIIFEKQFWVVSDILYKDRIFNLLKKTNLTDRFIDKDSIFEKHNSINWNIAHSKLNKAIDDSKIFLQAALNRD